MSCKTKKKTALRARRQRSVRSRVRGTQQRPRMSVFRSARHIYVQVIDDSQGKTLLALSTQSKELKDALAGKRPKEQAAIVGEEAAKKCLAQDIKQIAFDRNGFIYHGRVAAVADGARKGGLDF